MGLRLSPDGRVALQVPHAARPGQVEFRLVTASHQVLARKIALVGPGHNKGESVELQVGAPVQEPVYLEVEATGRQDGGQDREQDGAALGRDRTRRTAL